MKLTGKLIVFISLLMFELGVNGQTVPPGSRLLQKEEIALIFTDSVKNKAGIKFPIFNVYGYKAKAEDHYLVLCERIYKTENGKDLTDSIQAIDLVKQKNDLLVSFTIQDYINTETPGTVAETAIWFWTKYTNFSDIDGDGLADPIIVYGTSRGDDKSEGRIKMIVVYKGAKYVIRHQNSDMDWGRNTNVQSQFYKLPLRIQAGVKAIMRNMTNDNNAIFPAGWEKAMTEKKTIFDEN